MSAQTSIRDMFFEECAELLEALSDGLSDMESGEHSDETLNAVFRAVHSIKGGAGAVKLDALVAFAHRFETVLDELRSNRLVLTAEIMRVLHRSADHLTGLVEDASNNSSDLDAQTPQFLAALDACLGDADPATDQDDALQAFVPLALDLSAIDEAAAPQDMVYEIRFRPHPSFYANGHDPLPFLDALAGLGPVEVTAELGGLPDLEHFDPAQAYLSWTILLTATVPQATVLDVFEFAEGLCDLTIAERQGPLPALADDPVVEPEPSPTEERQRPAPAEPPGPETAGETDTTEASASAQKAAAKPTLRVDLDRVDRLINAVGELIINQSMIAQCMNELPLATDADVASHVEDYRLLARDIQEAVMAIRAQPVKPLFQRMSRIVRDAADSVGKTARLVTTGEAVEVDKTVLERLTDPLTHMIRNAVDHGLESAEDRIMAGKDPCGTIRLSAAHRSGSVVITIRDDGAGLNRARIQAIARQKGLIPEIADLTDPEIDSLLFMPGFSTASEVSNLSGRGVGLDVVRNALVALGGRVTISSTPGQGTEFTISLPLTLAVMDGMVVSVAGQTMVIPISSIVETILPARNELHMVGTGTRLFAVRDKFIPLVDVAEGLGFERPSGHPDHGTLLLVETEDQGRCALIVDHVFDQRQVVIKGLETNYRSVPGVSAATVLGDGQIALILDPEAITRKKAPHLPEPKAIIGMQEGKAHAVAGIPSTN